MTTPALITVPAQGANVPAVGGWCQAARPDPITGLVAFPDFDAALPDLLATTIRGGGSVGIAIGDVDHLKEYVENANDLDPLSFGHLAGNALMSRLGLLTAGWFRQQSYRHGCVSTFGGDEVILAAEVGSASDFHAQVRDLAGLLAAELPRTVSFAMAVVAPGQVAVLQPTPDWRRRLYVHIVASVDRCLFAAKNARGSTPLPFLVTTAVAELGPEDGPR